jgi:hypothetical protein
MKSFYLTEISESSEEIATLNFLKGLVCLTLNLKELERTFISSVSDPFMAFCLLPNQKQFLAEIFLNFGKLIALFIDHQLDYKQVIFETKL